MTRGTHLALTLAVLATGCVNDLAVGLSASEPLDEDAAPDEAPREDAAPTPRDAGKDAGPPRADAGPALDAGRSDAGTSTLDGSGPPRTDAGMPPRTDAGSADSATRDAGACRNGDARACGEDAGELPPCYPAECGILMITPADYCEAGWSQECRRGEDDLCGWVCVPPFTSLADADAATEPTDP